MAPLYNYYSASWNAATGVYTSDNASVLVRLGDNAAAWVKQSVGGLVWLARVMHDREGTLHVGPWQLLPGGWEHAETFYYDNGRERTYGTPPVVCGLDDQRFLLTFGLGDVGYVMVVRMDGAGSFSTGPAATFPSVGSPVSAGNTGPLFMSRTGANRAVIVRREYKQIGSATKVWDPESVVVSASGMGVAAGAPAAMPLPPSSGFWGWGSDDGTGFWGWSVLVVGTTWTTSLAWYREAGGVVERGAPIEIGAEVGSHRIPQFAPIGDQRTLAEVSRSGLLGAYRVDLYRREGLDIVVEDTWSGSLGPATGAVARERRSLVDAVRISTSERRYRQVSLAGEQYSLVEQAVYSYANTPPDQNAWSGGVTQFEWLSASRLLALYTVAGKPDNLTGGTQDRNHVLTHRLMTMVVPPICPPRYVGATSGPLAMRVSQAEAVVRVSPAEGLVPVRSRDGCGNEESTLSDRGAMRVVPVGPRR